MICNLKTVAFNGIEAKSVEVQVSIGAGIPGFVIVGLPDKAVNESRERVRAVFSSLGIDFPRDRVIVNLKPADLLKEGAHFDLPIAVCLLGAMGIVNPMLLKNYIFVGALSLDGSIERVNGVLPAAIHALSCQNGLVCPEANRGEALWSGCNPVIGRKHLLEVLTYFSGKYKQANENAQDKKRLLDASEIPQAHYDIDYADVKGQESAKRALLIAAAGGHNLLMSGPPGSGKTMLAERLVTILPPLSLRQGLENAVIRSVAGTLDENTTAGCVIDLRRPFRAPHHSASTPALVGGGRRGVPGEITLAHNGVLFLDELPEFSRATLEALRQPLENKRAVISRVMAHTEYPADFQLIAAMNPCRCGFFGVAGKMCARAPHCAIDYMSRLSGPFLDRFDLQIEVPAVSPYDLTSVRKGTNSAEMRKQVLAARHIAAERFASFGAENLSCNAELKGDMLEKALDMGSELRSFAAEAAEKCGLTARSFNRILRLARTIADLQNEKKVSKIHLIEALSYRRGLSAKGTGQKKI